MSLAGLVERYGRAIVLTVTLVSAAGIISGLALPSSIYPRLEFPRVVIIGHSGTLPAQTMMLSVTRPLEQAVMEVPGIRRVRSTTFRGATEISAQFEPATDMIVALQQVQGKIDDARQALPAGTDLVVERLTPAAFPMYILNLTGSVPGADLYDYAFYVMRPRLARVAGAGPDRRGVQRYARDRGRHRSGAPPGRGAHGSRCLRAAEGRQPARARGTVRVGRRAAARARLRIVAVDRRHQPDTCIRSSGRRTEGAGCGAGVPGLAGSDGPGDGERPRRCQHQRVAAGRRQHSRDRSRRRAGGRRTGARPPGGPSDHEGVRPRRVRARLDRQRPRCDPRRRLPCRRHPAAVPARLAPDAGRRRHPAAGGPHDVRGHAPVRRVDQPDVDGRPGGRDRPRHRRCRRRRRRDSSPCAGRLRGAGGRRNHRSDRTGHQLDAHDRRGVRAARAAVRRGGAVLPRAVADALRRGPRVAGARADADSAARALGHPQAWRRRPCPWETTG